MVNKRIALWIGFGLIGVVAVLLVAKARWDAAYFEGYDPELPFEVQEEPAMRESGYRRIEFSFQGVEGEDRVPGVLVTPPPLEEGAHPCVIFLHGIGQKKEFIDEIATPFIEAGFAMATFDQYTRGERRLPEEAGLLEEGLALRRRGALTVLETRRLVSYLESRKDIAKKRIYLVGASFGAITGATAFAFEPRLKAAVLVYGGGDLPLLLDSEQARNEIGVWAKPLTMLMSFLLAPADPIRYIDRAAPRPVLFQNGTHDTLVPASSGQALFEAAAEPKEIIWYDSDHIGLDEEHVWVVLEDAIEWLRRQDRQIRKAVEGTSHAT
ncbi:MAG: dienelactone hydrolase family protein [Candidatus Hydrogenedentota bacterium]